MGQKTNLNYLPASFKTRIVLLITERIFYVIKLKTKIVFLAHNGEPFKAYLYHF
jgi:hypothetical protein